MSWSLVSSATEVTVPEGSVLVSIIQASASPAPSSLLQLGVGTPTFGPQNVSLSTVGSGYSQYYTVVDVGTYAQLSSQFGSSGLTPVTGNFAATGQSAAFTPIARLPFNIALWGTFVGTVKLEKSFDTGTTWIPAAVNGAALSYTAPLGDVYLPAEAGVQYRLDCTVYTSGTINYRISQ